LEPLFDRLIALVDLSLTLNHIHWNVVGPHFIGAHELLDRQLEEIREMVDAIAERIATMGGTPIGTPGHVARSRDWDDYALAKATVPEHLAALDVVAKNETAAAAKAKRAFAS
jgi:starvation-inducible DNA-binding protein